MYVLNGRRYSNRYFCISFETHYIFPASSPTSIVWCLGEAQRHDNNKVIFSLLVLILRRVIIIFIIVFIFFFSDLRFSTDSYYYIHRGGGRWRLGISFYIFLPTIIMENRKHNNKNVLIADCVAILDVFKKWIDILCTQWQFVISVD